MQASGTGTDPVLQKLAGLSLTLSGILELVVSTAGTSAGLRSVDAVLVEEVLEGGRASGRRRSCGWWQAAEALDVDGDGGQDVLDVCSVLPSVAAAAHTVAVGELIDGALHSGAHRVPGLPLGCPLLGADSKLQVAGFSWWEAHGAGAFAGGGALGADRAGPALALGAGHLLAVEVDVEVVAAEALASAVPASGVARRGVTWCSRAACSRWTREVQPLSTRCSAGRGPRRRRRVWMPGRTWLSCVVAAVVATSVITLGPSGAQVPVRWAEKPLQLMMCPWRA
jgi:hypothetical protein